MKTLILALTLSLIPAAALAQTASKVSAEDANCTMATLYTSILTRAKGEFEAKIKSSMVKKFGKDVKYVITEKMAITAPVDEDPYYLLTISEVRIETPKGNILTLNPLPLFLRSKGAEFSVQYDDEGAFRAQTCSASFIGEFDPKPTVINVVTQVLVVALDLDSLSVSGFEVIKK